MLRDEVREIFCNRKIVFMLIIVLLLSFLFTYNAYAYPTDMYGSQVSQAFQDIYNDALLENNHALLAILPGTNYRLLQTDGEFYRTDQYVYSTGVLYHTKYNLDGTIAEAKSVISNQNLYSYTTVYNDMAFDGVGVFVPPIIYDFEQDGSLSVESLYPVVTVDKDIRLNIDSGTALGSIAVYEKSDTVNPIKYVNVMSISSTQIALGYIDIKLGNGDFVLRNNTTLELSYVDNNEYLTVEYYPSYYFASAGSTVLIDLTSYTDDDYMNMLIYGENNGYCTIRHMREDAISGLGDIEICEDISSLDLQAGYLHYLEFNNKDTALTTNQYYYFSSDVVPETPDKMIPIDSYEDESFIGEIFSIYDEMIIGDDENYFTFRYIDTSDFGSDAAYFRFVANDESQFYIVEKRLNPIEGTYNVERVRLSDGDGDFSYLFSDLDTSDLIEIYQVAGRGVLKIPEGLDETDYTLVKGYTDYNLNDSLGTDPTYSDYYTEIINTETSGTGTVSDVMEYINNGGNVSSIDIGSVSSQDAIAVGKDSISLGLTLFEAFANNPFLAIMSTALTVTMVLSVFLFFKP